LTLAVAGVATLIACSAFNGWTNPESPEAWRLAVTHPLIAVASAAILMAFVGAPSSGTTAASSTPAAGPRSSWLRNPALIYLGKISYGLYVVHVLGLFLAQRVTHPASLLGVMAQAALGLAITVALSAASYRWIESPFLRLKERFAHVQSRLV
jgi:peptidoglycan/LPS O-acetylase OafA/YrhL